MQAVGNDFVLVLEEDVAGYDLPGLTQEMSSRRFGVGSDGLLVFGRNESELTLRMFNPDGSEDFCGNGSRCAVWFAHEMDWIRVDEPVRLIHRGIEVPATVTEDGLVTVILRGATTDPSTIPLDTVRHPAAMVEETLHGLKGTAVSTGSAHFVAFVDDLPGDPEFQTTSQKIEHDSLFPERISVMWTQVASEGHLRLRIWERGAGETLGCGTGSTAAAWVYHQANPHFKRVRVSNPGGDIDFRFGPGDDIAMTSRAETVFVGEWTGTTRASALPEIAASL